MSQYLFILGREPELSVAELAAVAERDVWPLSWLEVEQTHTIVETKPITGWLNRLAGTVKISEVVGECPRSPSGVKQAVLVALRSVDNYPDYEFGLSCYGAKLPWLGAAGMNVKRELKSPGKHVRFVTSRGTELSSVVVAKRQLLPPRGFEFIVVPKGAHKLTLARTLEVQDFESWSERDYGRPQRDARVGMLPPKLARLMVNLAQVPKGDSILDPFCGSGTVLQEAALLGYTNLAGADADARGIDRTRINFDWLGRKFPGIVTPKLLAADVRALPREFMGQSFAGIVTEPYLGPPLTGREDPGRLKLIAAELNDFYRMALTVLPRLLAPRGRIVMVWPVIKAGRNELALPLPKILPELGLRLIDVLPPIVPQEWRTSRGILRYERPDARVGREIAVLQRV